MCMCVCVCVCDLNKNLYDCASNFNSNHIIQLEYNTVGFHFN